MRHWLFVVGVLGFSVTSWASGGLATVVAVVDGDTIDVRDAGVPQRVRLIGVDAPELHRADELPQYLGAEARAALARLLGAGQVRLIPDPAAGRDRFGRRLAYVETAQGIDVGCTLLEQGWARLFRRPGYVRFARYRACEDRARSAERGLWGAHGLAEIRWRLAQRSAGKLWVVPLAGARFGVVVDGWAKSDVETTALGDLLWVARRAQGTRLHDPAAADAALRAAGFLRFATAGATSTDD